MKLGILNTFTGKHQYYVQACEDIGVDYEVIDIISDNWVENIKNTNCDGFLVRPSDKKDEWKRMYDEKVYFLNKVMNKPIYPSYNELYLYENKRNMSYWLEINDIQHPKTYVFYRKEDALRFLKSYNNFPLVFKTNIGSAALGVKYIKSKKHAIKLVNKIFTKWKFYNKGYTKWQKSKYGLSYPLLDDRQHNFIIFQEKIDVRAEWRMIKIGSSFFGHQKLSDGEFNSGSNLVGWERPPEDILNLTKLICDIGNFNSMNIDIFEDKEGNYYVNELQTMFGSHDNSQMYIDGKPGRYVNDGNSWIFEEGYYNQNGSFNLRVLDFIEKINNEA